MCERDFEAAGGLVILGGGQLQIMRRLDATLLDKAISDGAHEIGFPPLSTLQSLDRIDYFRNFPHLGLAVAPLRKDALAQFSAAAHGATHAISADQMEDPQYFLPSAACYPVYSWLRDTVLDDMRRISTVQRCFRNEDSYEGLTRLLGFTMREMVAIGARDEVRQFLDDHKAWILRFSEGAGIALDVRAATDPFFESGGDRARMQQLFPVKEEFVFEDTVAVASVNFHRNYFAERWNIRTAKRQFAFSGCVAFGLERWLHALARSYDGDFGTMLAAIAAGSAYAAGNRHPVLDEV